MKISFSMGGKACSADLARPLSIAIPVRFDGAQLSAFGAPPAKKEPYKAGSFIGNVLKGGSCNCEVYTINPHCNGTHTESVGHITGEPLNVHEALQDSLVPAALVTVNPESAAACREDCGAAMKPGDLVITKKSLEIMPVLRETHALIVRTMPNDGSKATRDYGASMPPYFTRQAMEYIATSSGLTHLLVDMPSIDRLDDDGALANHRLFWGVAPGDTDAGTSPKTVTELVYVPNAIEDGIYLLNLQIAPFMADAAPSRPVLYEVKQQ